MGGLRKDRLSQKDLAELLPGRCMEMQRRAAVAQEREATEEGELQNATEHGVNLQD